MADDQAAAFAADEEFHQLIIEPSGSETPQVLAAMIFHILRERGSLSHRELLS